MPLPERLRKKLAERAKEPAQEPKAVPQHLSEVERILRLPRRPSPSSDVLALYRAEIESMLSVGSKESCSCESRFHRTCCSTLMDNQAWALEELRHNMGLVGSIGVGHGKTLLDLLAPMVVPCRVALLLVPPNLQKQLAEDIKFYSGHWKLPNIVGSQWFYPGRPVLHVVAYTKLSGAKSTDLLGEIRPDFIILDEAHCVADTSSVRGSRFARYMRQNPGTKLACWSGTLTKRQLRDWAHFAVSALGAGAPVPRDYPTLEFWANALDPSDFPGPPGDILKLCEPGEQVVDGFGRRVRDTPGVVSSGDKDSCQASLVLSERPFLASAAIQSAVAKVQSTWQRPDGGELVDPLAVSRCLRETSCGFFYYWTWPRGESKEVQTEWLTARKAWHKELREELKHPRPHLDSPLLLARAAIRWFDGYNIVEADGSSRHVGPKQAQVSPKHPVWASETWERWKKARPTASPETSTEWFDMSLIRDIESWVGSPGLAWYEFDAIAKAVKLPRNAVHCGPGSAGDERVLSLTGKEAALISIKAHGTGKNLQMHNRNLVINPPSGGAEWEQLIGRTHRTGQRADEVTVDVYRHTQPLKDAVEAARQKAWYIYGVFGNTQKLISKATWTFSVG